MRTFALTCLLLAVLVLPSAAQCPTIAGRTLPCTFKEHQETPQPPAPLGELPALPDPLFRAEHLAKDAPPEWLALLNDPTWENAIRYVQVDLYRKYRFEVANQLANAARHAITHEVEQKTGLSIHANWFPFLQEFSRMWGLPTTDVSSVPSPASLKPDDATAHLLAEGLLKGKAQP